MGLTDRLSNSGHGGRPTETAGSAGSLIGATVRRRKDAIADSSRRLKVKVHNKLFETIDVAKLESLEPAMVSIKVTAAINDILNEDGRLLTDTDRAPPGRGNQERAARARPARAAAPRRRHYRHPR